MTRQPWIWRGETCTRCGATDRPGTVEPQATTAATAATFVCHACGRSKRYEAPKVPAQAAPRIDPNDVIF